MEDDGTMQDLTHSIIYRTRTLRDMLREKITVAFEMPELDLADKILRHVETIIIPMCTRDQFDETIIPGFTYNKYLKEHLKALRVAMPMIRYVVTEYEQYSLDRLTQAIAMSNSTSPFVKDDLNRLGLNQDDQRVLHAFRVMVDW